VAGVIPFHTPKELSGRSPKGLSPVLTLHITRSTFEAKKLELANNGVRFSEDTDHSGTASSRGAVVHYEFDVNNGFIRFNVLSCPLLVSRPAVESTIQSWFEEKSS